MPMQQWPEGPAADPKAARERYEADLREARRSAREALRADMLAANVGLGLVVGAALVGYVVAPVAGALLAAGFAALFFITLAVMYLRGIRGTDAVRRAYLFTFGWANWI